MVYEREVDAIEDVRLERLEVALADGNKDFDVVLISERVEPNELDDVVVTTLWGRVRSDPGCAELLKNDAEVLRTMPLVIVVTVPLELAPRYDTGSEGDAMKEVLVDCSVLYETETLGSD